MAAQLDADPSSSVAPASAIPTYSPFSRFTHLDDPDDRRQCRRRSLHCGILLLEGQANDSEGRIPGECLNVCDGGLYATVPLGYGVCLGQRYTFRLMVGERGPEPGAIQVVSQQGLIVRTELLVGRSGADDRLGIAVKLAGHRSGVIPMPSW